MYQTLLLDIQNGIATVIFNRPEKLNALNSTVMMELDRMMDQLQFDETVKGIIFTGAGAKSFVAGADITEFVTLTADSAKELATRGQDIFFKIERSAKPVIAAVNGFALGGGCELAMSCHLRIASDNAKFGQPEVALGLMPGYGGTQRLTQLVGKGKAMEMILSGTPIDATEAYRIGLANHIVSAEELLPFTRRLMETILTRAPLAIAGSISAIQSFYDTPGRGFQKEVEAFGQCFDTADLKEGVHAFLEKRKAVFEGR